jgi:hypothetical protein
VGDGKCEGGGDEGGTGLVVLVQGLAGVEDGEDTGEKGDTEQGPSAPARGGDHGR